MGVYLNTNELEKNLKIVDLTDKRNGTHAINIIVDRIEQTLKDHYKQKVSINRTSPIVTVENNFDNLYYPKVCPARDKRYTRYIDSNTLLRTQMTSSIPPLLKQISEPEILLCPGLVYRRDVIDKTHVGEPHQLDIWKVDNKHNTIDDLKDIVGIILKALMPNAIYRYNPTEHYYTQNGLEIEILLNGKWIEVLECGLIHPNLIHDAGLTDNYGGLAIGIGLDRLVMLIKQIDDIRILRNTDPRIQCQMNDLSIYKPMSNQPPITRDLSVAVASDDEDEDIAEYIRKSLGEELVLIEEIKVIACHYYNDLPNVAIERLGMSKNQKNVLIRVVLRDLKTTLTSTQANIIYNKIYNSVHKGTTGYIIK